MDDRLLKSNFRWLLLSIEFGIEITVTMLHHVLNLHNATPRTNLMRNKVSIFRAKHSVSLPKDHYLF